MKTTCQPWTGRAPLRARLGLLLALLALCPAAYGLNFNIALASLTNHNTSAYPAYNQANFPANFGTTTWINPDGQTIPVDPTQADESLNPVTPGHVSSTDVHTLIPSRPNLRWFAHATPWFGTSSHINIGLTNNSTAYVAAMITDMKNRGFNGVVIDWYGMTDGTDGVVQKMKAYLAGIPNNTFTYIIMVDGGIKGGTGNANLQANIQYCQAQYFSDPNYEHEPVSTGEPILMFFNVRATIGEANMISLKSALGGNMVWVEQGTSYLSEPWEDEAFEWTASFDGAVNASDPFNLGAVTADYSTFASSGKKSFGGMCSQFDGTLTKTVGWSLGKYLPGSNGLCLVERAATINSAIPSSMTRMQWPTWSDWEEGTEVEAAIENHVALSVQTNATGGISWSVTAGEPRTIDHYEIYASADGNLAALLASVPASQTNLSQLPIASGNYLVYVYAVAIPCVRNHLSPGVSLNLGPAFSATSYNRQMPIAFTGYNRSSAVTNFPVLVELSTNLPGFAYSQFASPAGYDLAFTDASGDVLPYEIDQWNPNGVSLVWVNVPGIASANDYILAYWGNAAGTNAPGTATNGAAWQSFSTVLHLKESGFPYADSTTLHPALSGVAPALTTAGLVGNAENFDGASQYVVPAGANNLANSFSLSAWVKLNSAATNIQAIWVNKTTGGNANGVGLYINSYNTADGKLVLETGDGTTGLNAVTTAGAVPVGAWHFVFASVNRTAGTAQLYVDGTNLTASSAIVTDLGNNSQFNLGRFTNSTWFFKGSLDEARIETARTADWVWTAWMNVVSNATLATYGPITSAAVLNQGTFSSGMKLVLSGYTHATTLTNFPVLINLSTNVPGFSYSQFASPMGDDLRFTDASGEILCPAEIDTWNTNGTSSVWVLAPSISSANSYLLAFWGNPTLTNPPASSTNGAVWAGYSAVLHLRDSGFPYADSTTLHPAIGGIAPTVTTGVVGNGQTFDGATEYLAPAGAVSLGNSFSLSAWVNLSPTAANLQTLWANKPAGGNANGIALFVNTYNTTDGKLMLESGDGTTGITASTPVGVVPPGGWHHVFASINRSAGTAQLFVDGVNQTVTNTVATDFGNYCPFNLGRYTNGWWYFKGSVDEARIEPARSADWVWATWMNVVSNSAFVSFSSVASPGVVLNQPQPQLGATVGANGLLLNWAAQGSQFTIYSATNLAPPIQWTPVSNYTVLSSGLVQVPLSAANGTPVFYRIESP